MWDLYHQQYDRFLFLLLLYVLLGIGTLMNIVVTLITNTISIRMNITISISSSITDINEFDPEIAQTLPQQLVG